jgi:hypothetical protein
VLTAYEQGIRFTFMNLKWRYKNKKGKNDFVAASKKTGKQNLKICACNLALLPAIYRKILST